MSNCPNCHAPLEAENLKYCPSCHFRFDEKSEDTVDPVAFMNGGRTIPRGLIIAGGVVAGILCLCLLGWLISTIASSQSGPVTPEPTRTLPPSNQTQTAVAQAVLSRTPTPMRTTTPTITPTRTATPVPSPTPNFGRAVFASDRNNGLNIFIMDGNGFNQKLLVKNLGGNDDCPSVSPNRLAMAFCSTREKPGTQDLYLQDLKTASVYQLTGTPGKENASPSWFPDSFHLAFTSNRDGHWAIYETDADSTDVKAVITSTVDLTSVSVSPDGTMFAYICGKELCMANVSGNNTQIIYRNGIQKDHPVWSSDGYKLAYTQHTTGTKSALYLLDLASLSATKLVDNGNSPAWSPDGQHLMYASDLRGHSNIYVYELPTGNIFPVTNSTQFSDYSPFWF